jgi:hypothetical protein
MLDDGTSSRLKPKICTQMRESIMSKRYKVYSEFTTENGFPFEPHEWPNDVKSRRAVRRHPYMLDDWEISNLVGCTVDQFWELVDFFESKLDSSYWRKGLSLPAQVLLYRSRLRYGSVPSHNSTF